jgi:hypothetical protein
VVSLPLSLLGLLGLVMGLLLSHVLCLHRLGLQGLLSL